MSQKAPVMQATRIVICGYRTFRSTDSRSGGVFAPVWYKNGYALNTFGLERGMIFERMTGVYERIYGFNSKLIRKKYEYRNSKWI